MVEKSSKWVVPKLQFKTILRFKRPVSMIFLPYNIPNKTFERISYFDPKLCIGYNCRGILPWGIITRAHLGAYNAGAMGTYITYISGMLAPLHPAKSRPCPVKLTKPAGQNWLLISLMAPFHFAHKLCIREGKSTKIFSFDFVYSLWQSCSQKYFFE